MKEVALNPASFVVGKRFLTSFITLTELQKIAWHAQNVRVYSLLIF